MEQKFKIQVPDGCSASIEQQNGFLVVTFEPKKYEPKDGDVCVSNSGTIFIFNGNGIHKTSLHCALFKAGDITYSGALNSDNTTGYRYATDDEKQRLFDALAKVGKRWNAETKQIEDLPRWRAGKFRTYYFIQYDMKVMDDKETGCRGDDDCYFVGNYFKTREAASRAAEKIRKILKESEAE